MSVNEASSNADCLTLPLDLYPALNPFALDLVRGESNAVRFCHRESLDRIQPRSTGRNRDELSDGLARANRDWGNDVADVLSRWKEGDTLTLIAGQQVGLGGGAIYTLAKVASLIRFRRMFEASGRKATAFFWLATEDHDFDEVARLDLVDGSGIARLRSTAPASREVVGARSIPEDLRRDLCRVLNLENPSWLAPGVSFRDSFARLIAEVLPGEVVMVDSLLPELRRAGKSVLIEMIDHLDQIQDDVAHRALEIEKAGYKPQIVEGEDGYSILYALDERNQRRTIRTSSEGPSVEGWDVDLGALAEESPERISTAALMRPLLQDYVFDTDLFLGGPAEVSYYAQLGPLYERFSIRQPHVALRGHALLAPAKVLAAIDRYSLSPSEIFDSVDEIVLRRENERVRDLEEVVDRMESQLEGDMEKIGQIVVPSDRSMAGSIDRTNRKIRYHFDRLRLRGARVIARYDEERYRAVAKLGQHLCPGGIAQDRTIGWIGYWSTYGRRLVDRLVDQIEPDQDVFKVIGL